MTDLQKGIQDFMKTGDNVALMNTMKSEIYSKLADNQEYSALVSELDKYATAYDDDLEKHQAADNK